MEVISNEISNVDDNGDDGEEEEEEEEEEREEITQEATEEEDNRYYVPLGNEGNNLFIFIFNLFVARDTYEDIFY